VATGNGTTIFALSSGALPAGIAVLRVSGPEVRNVLETIVGSIPEPRRTTLVPLRGQDGGALDTGLVLYFPGPASFTGEDVVEFHVHGGRAVVAAVLGAIAAVPGLRPADAGEFTRRAFTAGRLDLTEVEGLADLIQADTESQRRQALRQASGAQRRVIEAWRSRLITARAMVEAELDFADEDDVPDAVSARAWDEVRGMAAEIARHLDDGGRGERLRDGAEVVVTGPVNAGKSSLINALARRDVAIVSDEPGTTRDLIEVRLDVDGYPFTIVDTAGLRDAEGKVEREGIRRGRERAAAADLVLELADVTVSSAPPLSGALRVGTKVDLIDSASERERLSSAFDVLVSADTGEGIDALLARLAAFGRERMEPGESALITQARHRHALSACRSALLAALDERLALELRAEELRHATDALGRLTGRVDVEDLLDVIFRDFCIGK